MFKFGAGGASWWGREFFFRSVLNPALESLGRFQAAGHLLTNQGFSTKVSIYTLSAHVSVTPASVGVFIACQRLPSQGHRL